MNLHRMLAIVLLLLVTSRARAEAEPVAPLPNGGKALVAPDDIGRFAAVGLQGEQSKRQRVAGQSFTETLVADVQQPPDDPWLAQYVATIDQPVKSDDVLHLRFHARNLYSMTGSANLGVVFEMNEPPHTKSVDMPITVGTEWEVVDVPFVAGRDFAAGKSQLGIRLGYARQTVQIGGVQLINYGTNVKLADLPRRKFTYAGREPDAAWRKEALERIDKLRKADMTILVKDAAGNPIPNATVSAELSKHAFGFGTAISMRLLEESPDGEMYRRKVVELFNTSVLENELKWPNIVGHKYANSDRLVSWLKEHRLSVRGHTLVWPGEQWLPKHVLALQDKPDALRQAIAEHIRTTASRYSGQLIDWDVMNEPFSNHLFMDILGKEAMVEWFKLAREADPRATLYINDYAILASGNMLDTPHQRHYYDTIKYLIDNGAPVQGIGMQGHFGMNVTSPENLLKILDRYAQFGLPIKVTELDMNMVDEELRADYMRDFHIALFSHPSVEGILQWGFWEGAHWIPSAALFNLDWTIRPHGQAYIDLVHGEWKTKATGTTDSDGAYQFRGFHGDYDLTVNANGKTKLTEATLTRESGKVVVVIQ